MFNLTNKEERILKSLDTPAKIQDFLNKIPTNFDYWKDTCMSPRRVLRENKCHCIEGAFLAALALKLQGKKPLIMHFETIQSDEDHVIAVFREKGKWGAISKTNHSFLRYREPVYNSIRELAMSFFHEYTDKKRDKTMRSYSEPIDLSVFNKSNWATDENDLWYIDDYIDTVKHHPVLTKEQIKNLRKADKIEVMLWKIREWERGRGKVH